MMNLSAAARAVLADRLPRTLKFGALALATLFVATACGGGFATERGWSSPVVVGGVLYVGNQDGQVLAFRANLLDDSDRRSAPTVDLDDPDNPQTVSDAFITLFQAIDDDGEETGGFYASPLIAGEAVIIGGIDGHLYALSLLDEGEDEFEELWKRPFRTNGNGAGFELNKGGIFATAATDGERIFVADNEGFLYGVNLADGRAAWDNSFKAEERFWSSPTVADGVVYIGNMDHSVYALNAETGGLLWRFRGSEGAFVSKPVVIDGTVYIGALDNTFYAIDAADGSLKSSYKGDGWFWNDPVHVDGTIYVGTLGRHFYALNAADLSERWSFETSAAIRGQAALYEGQVFVALRNGEILTLSQETGRLVGQRISPLGERVLASLAIHDGVLYVRDEDQRLYRFGLDRDR